MSDTTIMPSDRMQQDCCPNLNGRAGSYYLNPYLLVLLLPRLMPAGSQVQGAAFLSRAHSTL